MVMNFVLVKTFNFKPLAASAAGLARSFMCMVQPLLLKSKIKFLMDTGCGHDLISQTKVEKHDLETLVGQETVSFQAAISNFKTESFEEPINAYILDDTPSVLSIGKRCMKQRYGFLCPLDVTIYDQSRRRTHFTLRA